MKLKLVLITLISIALYSCVQDDKTERSNRNYQQAKSFFKKKYIDHFPDKIPQSVEGSAVISSRDETKNDFNLLLYEYEVGTNEINLTLGKIKNKAIAKYNYLDSCLLVVNRFETENSKDSLEIPMIMDSTLINRNCYDKKYPIPNFIGFHQNDMNRDSRLDETFTIYVLEAKKNDSWGAEFAMEANPQMPNNWKNGFSKGVAISLQKSTIIYWTVIW